MMWWPSPEALGDLKVEETDTGFKLSAPDDTECGAWLYHFSQTEELHEEFELEFTTALINFLQDTYGKNEITDQSESDCKNSEENIARPIQTH